MIVLWYGTPVVLLISLCQAALLVQFFFLHYHRIRRFCTFLLLFFMSFLFWISPLVIYLKLVGCRCQDFH